ncbi:hypothetical protein [Streptomyces sp. NPDC054874]
MPQSATVALVPLRMDAWLLNKAMCDAEVQKAQPYYRAQPDYEAQFAPPEPMPLDPSDLAAGKAPGMYLHWRLPSAIGQGRVKAEDGPHAAVDFPPAPNRWLVLRYYHPSDRPPDQTPDVAGWLVESDFTADDPAKATSPVAKNVWMGRSLDLTASAFAPHTPTGRSDLTIMGHKAHRDLPTFSAFQPYCQDVFSLHDPAYAPGSTDAGTMPAGQVSYAVIGWHTHSQDEPAAMLPQLLDFYGDAVPTDRAELAELAAQHLDWDPQTPLATTTRCLYHAMVLAVRWDPKAGAPTTPHKPSDPRQQILTALGHDMAEATATLIEQTLPAPPTQPADAAESAGPAGALSSEAEQTASLLRAFHTGHLNELDRATNQAAQPALLHTACHRDWFTLQPSGTRWHLTPLPEQKPPPLTPAQYTTARSKLAALNNAQADLDQRRSDAAGLRRKVADLWWLLGVWNESEARGHRPEGFDQESAKALNPAASGTPAHALKTALDSLPALEQTVTTQRTALEKILPSGYGLQPRPTDPHYSPTDPVVLLRGTGQRDPLRSEDALPTRDPARTLAGAAQLQKSETETQIVFSVTAPGAPLWPPHGTEALKQAPEAAQREAAARLANELYLLHALASYLRRTEKLADDAPLNRRRVKVSGTWPPHTTAWRQPWTPLTLAWLAAVYPLPYDADQHLKHRYWTFDGTRRQLDRQSDTVAAVQGRFGQPPHFFTLQGRSLLTPVPGFTLQRRVDAHRRTYPQDQDTFADFRRRAGTWDLQAQALSGIRAALQRRTDAPARALPTPALAPLLTGAHGPWPDPRRSHHQLIPAAHLAIERAVLIDTFGQAITVVSTTEAQHLAERPYRGRSVLPPYAVDRNHPERFVQIPPRLRQPARLCLTPLDHTCTTGQDREADPASDPLMTDPSPLGGWIIACRTNDALRCTLALYDPHGRALGEVQTVGPAERRAVTWRPLPDSRLHRPEDVFTPAFAAACPALAGFLTELCDRNADAITTGRAPATDRPQRLAELASTINTSLLHSTHRPPYGTAAAAGYPLVLVRLRLHLELDTSPQADPNWGTQAQGYGSVFEPPEKLDPAYLTRRWPVRLGAPTDLADGLIGYYTNPPDNTAPGATSYRHLHTTHPAPGNVYTRTITTGDALAVPALPRTRTVPRQHAVYLTALMDPRALLTATSDLLPATTFALPDAGVHARLQQMPLSIPLGPALARTTPPAKPGQIPRLTLPAPSAAGRWDFADLTGAPPAWQHYQLTSGPHQARLQPESPQAHTGYLTVTRREGDQ